MQQFGRAPAAISMNTVPSMSSGSSVSPFVSETRLGDANPFPNINFNKITSNFGPGIEISKNGAALQNSMPKDLGGQIDDALQNSSVFKKLTPEAQKDISNMLANLATGDFSANNVIKGTFDAIIDNTSLPPNEKQDITKLVNALCDIVATASFLAALPESCLAVFSDDAGEALSAANNLAQTAKGWGIQAGVPLNV